MKFAKYLFVAIIAAIKKEMTIQKPVYVAEQAHCHHKKSSRGADAFKGLLILIIAPIIFVILAGLVI